MLFHCSSGRNQNRVAEARDREELADALQKREDHRLKEGHRARYPAELPPPSPREELDAESIGRRDRFAVVQRRRVASVARHRHARRDRATSSRCSARRWSRTTLTRASSSHVHEGGAAGTGGARVGRNVRRRRRRDDGGLARWRDAQPEAGVALGATSAAATAGGGGRSRPSRARRRGRCSRAALPSSARSVDDGAGVGRGGGGGVGILVIAIDAGRCSIETTSAWLCAVGDRRVQADRDDQVQQQRERERDDQQSAACASCRIDHAGTSPARAC